MMKHVVATLTISAGLLALSPLSSAQAQEADAEGSAICTDRPTKSNAACTVPDGHFQYEADVLNYSELRAGGTTTTTWLFTNPTVKYGLSKTVDIEANFVPWQVVRTRDANGNAAYLHGPGDLFLRAKWNFYADPKLSVTALPYIKAPTARLGIGNGAYEGGLIVPVNYQLDDKITLTTVPEWDALKNSSSGGYHSNTSQLVNVGYALPKGVTAYLELWGDWNADPSHFTRQYSADTALAWGITKTFQLDVGVNFGLNSSTPRVQLYAGASQSF